MIKIKNNKMRFYKIIQDNMSIDKNINNNKFKISSSNKERQHKNLLAAKNVLFFEKSFSN